jgi:apolipoprotein N-acyltransferase
MGALDRTGPRGLRRAREEAPCRVASEYPDFYVGAVEMASALRRYIHGIRTRATIVVGLIHVAPPFKYNQARVYAPGAPTLSYDKEHMLPPFESKFKPGTALALMSEPSGTWGVAICKDMDFTQLSRKYGGAGVGLMLVPAWDFDEDRWSHGHMAVMRGVESGFSVVRSAKRGYLTVSDNRGRILAETASNSAPFATLLAAVPVVHDTTLYLLLGDWFGWLALALFAFTLVRCVLLLCR